MAGPGTRYYVSSHALDAERTKLSRLGELAAQSGL